MPSCKEVIIRRIGVGLLAFVAVAAAGWFLRSRRSALAPADRSRSRPALDELYAAGL